MNAEKKIITVLSIEVVPLMVNLTLEIPQEHPVCSIVFWKLACFYCVSFVFLGLHLLHGFASSLKTMGIPEKFLPTVQLISVIYSYSVVLGFILIAIVHYFH